MKLGTFDGPDDAFPVPLRVDNEGNIYTADYENGGGTVSADIFKFTPAGDFLLKANDPGLFGPFGLAISGTVLAGDPPVEWSYHARRQRPRRRPADLQPSCPGPPDMFLDPTPTPCAGTSPARTSASTTSSSRSTTARAA
jgi:hypothetical protein